MRLFETARIGSVSLPNRLIRSAVFPLLKLKIKPFTPNYNLPFAEIAKQYTRVPIICVGGFRQGDQIMNAINFNRTDFISLCRPLICEPDFLNKLQSDPHYLSQCINCNYCSIMRDLGQPTRCYRKGVIQP
ncbi:MAG: hypothetical protein PVH64_04970 [Bacillota bacterium]|jgi:2,4-dienoyl-CoA reductase-like NADH-dependent reductase (Old Yellow Enzyme family)